MRGRMFAVFGAGLIAGAAASLGAVGLAGGTLAAGKSTSRVVLENERVRVRDATFAPGDRRPGMHTHEYAHVGVVIDGGTLRFNYPDGKSETLNLRRGAAGWRDANVTHEAVNLGSRPVRVIEVEIK